MPPSLERPFERGRRSPALGEQEANRHAVEPPRGKRESVRGRRVEPLDVVDGD
jgi:hypothetical protein